MEIVKITSILISIVGITVLGVFSDQFLVWFSYSDHDAISINGTRYNKVEILDFGLKQARDVTVFINGKSLDLEPAYCLEGKLNTRDRITEVHFDKMSPYQNCFILFDNNTKPTILAVTAENRMAEPVARTISIALLILLVLLIMFSWLFVQYGILTRDALVNQIIKRRYVHNDKHLEVTKKLQKFYWSRLTKFDAAIIFEIYNGSKTISDVAKNLKFPKFYVKQRIKKMRRYHILILHDESPYPNKDIVDFINTLQNTNDSL